MQQRWIVIFGFAALVLCVLAGWLLWKGTVVVRDPSRKAVRIEQVVYSGIVPLHALTGGVFVGLVAGEGHLRAHCEDGRVLDFEYVTTPAWHIRHTLKAPLAC